MNTRQAQFRAQVKAALEKIDPETLAYDQDEFWMLQSPYEYIEFYAYRQGLYNTALALPLARGLHNGTHRKFTVLRDGVAYRQPYLIHCLLVCRMLLDLHSPLPREEEDILLAAALCHDMIEDIPFEQGGQELTTRFGLDPRVYQTVKLVSKRKDFTPAEEQAHFDAIAANPLSLLVKLSDRSHNVEDLYNRPAWKVHEYIGETEKYFMPMCEYGLAHYPTLSKSIEILQDKIISLTRASRILVDRCEEREGQLRAQLQALQLENDRLRAEYRALWEG